MKPFLFDTHAHAQFAAYKEEAAEVLRRSLGEGVLVNIVGTQIDTSKSAVALAESCAEGVYATVGLHPIHLTPIWHDPQELGGGTGGFKSREEGFDFAVYRTLAQSKKVVAIGEMGLDYYRIEEVMAKSGDAIEIIKQRQQEAFGQGIDLAVELRG